MINTNPDTEDRLQQKKLKKDPNPNADQQDHPTHSKIINSPFTSFEEVRAKHQTAQSNYVKNQIRRGFFKC